MKCLREGGLDDGLLGNRVVMIMMMGVWHALNFERKDRH